MWKLTVWAGDPRDNLLAEAQAYVFLGAALLWLQDVQWHILHWRWIIYVTSPSMCSWRDNTFLTLTSPFVCDCHDWTFQSSNLSSDIPVILGFSLICFLSADMISNGISVTFWVLPISMLFRLTYIASNREILWSIKLCLHRCRQISCFKTTFL